MTIAEFLKARLAEDAAVATRLDEGQRSWTWLPDPKHPDYQGEVREIFLEACNTTAPGFIQYEAGEHIARHDPASVLADIAAKRAIVAEYERVERSKDTYAHYFAAWVAMSFCVRQIARLYESHPEFKAAWR